MHIEYTDPRKSDLKYIVTMIILALAIAACSMSGNIGIKLENKSACRPGVAMIDPDMTPCIMGFGE